MVFDFTPSRRFNLSIYFDEFESLIELCDQDNNEASNRNMKSS